MRRYQMEVPGVGRQFGLGATPAGAVGYVYRSLLAAGRRDEMMESLDKFRGVVRGVRLAVR